MATKRSTALTWIDARTGPGRPVRDSVAGQHREDAFDVVAELLHEVAEEGRGRLVGDLAVVGDESRPEGHVGLRGGHLAGVAEAEDAAEALLGERGADLAGRGADDGG